MRQSIYHTRRTELPLGRRTHLVGILNVTPDSFSDGGRYTSDDLAVRRFHEMVRQGASIIDVGGESTRPGHTPVTAAEEMARIIPLIEAVRPETEALISVDTSKAEVADAALAAGADIVNDVWGARRDPDMAAVIARHDAACILMHNRPAEEAGVGDVIEAIRAFLEESVALVREAGVRADAICLDPGLGFGKTFDENWTVMRRLSELNALGYPLLIGASRKSMIAKLLDLPDPADRLYGTLAATALGIQSGVDFVRVHDVLENRQLSDVIDYCARHEPD
ncbi:MAG: dihydropteroate synthase [Verrucomicrobiota bacterium]